jgi:ATP-dependent DNA helicase RecG
MNIDKQLQFILREGEGYKVEFKEKLNKLDREIVAFANSAGGSIYLGVSDEGEAVGVEITNKLKSEITDIARNCDPGIKIKLITHDVANLIEIQVSEGKDKPYRCKDGFFLRIGPSTQKLRRDEIIELINNTGKIRFDEILNNNFQYPKDFSKQALQEYLLQCGIETRLPVKQILLNLNVAQTRDKDLVFNNTGVLFFAEAPQKFLAESYITAVRYKTQDRFSIIDKKDFMGNPLSQIEQTLAFLVRHMQVSAEIRAVKREEVYDYPLVALREAIVNAVTHRDYFYDASHIYVHMYPDKIEIESPGSLYHGLTEKDLGKRSIRRNRLLADLLHRAGYIERVGSGFDRMQHALAENGNPPLEVAATNFFNIRFYKRMPKKQVHELTSRQLQLYRLFQQSQVLSKNAAAVALGVSNDTALRELAVLTKYRLIEKRGVGRATMYHLKKMD